MEIKGLLEVWYDTWGTVGSWDSICFDAMSIPKAGMACRQMGFTSQYYDGAYLYRTSRGADQDARFESLECASTAAKLSDCKENDCALDCCDQGQDTGIACDILLPQGEQRAFVMNRLLHQLKA